LERHLPEASPSFISAVVIAGTTRGLERACRFPATKIAAAIERLLAANRLLVEKAQEVYAAMVALQDGFCAFADALIGVVERLHPDRNASFSSSPRKRGPKPLGSPLPRG
jgi:predicted nucleic-acid-binding protein